VVEQAQGTAEWQPSRLLRVAAPLSFASASVVGIAQFRFPASADRLLLWLSLGMISWSLFDRQRARRLALEWLPFVALILAYDLLRGRADHLFGAHALPQIWISEHLGHGTVPVVWLQQHLWHGATDLRWYDYACFAVYLSHFLVTPLLAGLIWLRAPHLFRRYGAMVLTLAFLGVTTYTLFPGVPPWLASNDHLLPPVARIIPAVSTHIGFLDYGAVFEQGNRYVNEVAAVPSLHAAYALLAALVLASLTRRRLARAALMLYPLAMGFALLYTGEHYTIDIVLGWLYALAVFRLVSHFAVRRRTDEGSVDSRSGRRPSARWPAPRSRTLFVRR
jgi:membrane-associated phospholipid phosphatase